MSHTSKFNIKSKSFLIVKIISFFLVIYFFFRFINQKDLLSTLNEISIKEIFLIYLLYLFLPILFTLRWFIVVQNFSKITFLDLLRNIVSGFSFSLILSSALVIDAAKFIKIKKEIGYKNSLILVSIDKFLAAFFKIIFLSVLVIFYLYFYTEVNFNYILISVFFFFIAIFIFSKIDKIFIFLCKKFLLKKNIENIDKIFKKIKKSILKLLLANLIIQLVNVSLYFLVFLFLSNHLEFIKLLIFVPVIELLGQFSFLIFGMKEISTVFILSFIDIDKELALAAALLYLFSQYLVIISLLVITNLNKINYYIKK